MKKYIRIVNILMLLVLLMVPVLAFAQTLLPSFVPNPGPPLNLSRVEALIRRVGAFLMTIAIVIAVMTLVWAGIKYMLAGANENKVQDAKLSIKNGIIGAAVVLGVGLILQTLSSILTQTFFGV
jgi:hypothetical protein